MLNQQDSWCHCSWVKPLRWNKASVKGLRLEKDWITTGRHSTDAKPNKWFGGCDWYREKFGQITNQFAGQDGITS